MDSGYHNLSSGGRAVQDAHTSILNEDSSYSDYSESRASSFSLSESGGPRHITDQLVRMENRATLSIPSANATVEDMIKLDREFYQHQQPPFVVQRQNKIPRVALLCNKQGRYTEQEVSIEMRDWDGGNRVYPVALVAGEERVLQSCKGGPGGCFFRLWLGHQRGLSDQVFARPKIPPSHGGQRSKMKHAIDSTDEDSDTTYGTGKEKSTPKGNIPTKRIRPVTRTTPSVQGVSRTVQHACETCNRVKAKCDRVVPSCGTCQNAQRECDYGDSSRERETR